MKNIESMPSKMKKMSAMLVQRKKGREGRTVGRKGGGGKKEKRQHSKGIDYSIRDQPTWAGCLFCFGLVLVCFLPIFLLNKDLLGHNRTH